jgi:peptide/nickel transport system ATP-binding protein
VTLLDVQNLKTEFWTPEGAIRAVDRLSFVVCPGETVALLGESGCGKSVTALSILRLLKEPPARISGAVRFEGRDLLSLRKRELRAIRGNEISMIFQEPMTSLNPVLSIGRQIGETVRLHESVSRTEARDRAAEMLVMVGVPDPVRRLRQFPHQLSGGMRQRVMIAIALACRPKLLIADEPTTSLDMTIQAQVLDLIRDLKQRLGSAVVLITHDFGVVAEMADRVVVMYAGRKVEEGPVSTIFSRPRHPYTRALLQAVPRLGATARRNRQRRLPEIPGVVPSLLGTIDGCAFADRCALATDVCRELAPAVETASNGQAFACHHAEKIVMQ